MVVALIACVITAAAADQTDEAEGYHALPLPAATPAGWTPYMVRARTWLAGTLSGVYRQKIASGKPWDGEVQALMDDYVDYLIHGDEDRFSRMQLRAAQHARFERRAEQLQKRGCTDCALAYLRCCSLLFQGKIPGLAAALTEVAARLDASPYPAMHAAQAYQLAYATSMFSRKTAASGPQLLAGFSAAASRMLTQAETREPFAVLQIANFLLPEAPMLGDRPYTAPVYDALLAVLQRPGVDAYAAELLSAYVMTQQTRFVDASHFAVMASARDQLIRAWKHHPEVPGAATKLIRIMCMAGESSADQREWFDRAVAAEFDYLPAYWTMTWCLHPRWGGSFDAVLAFATEVAATKRFDTDVPAVIMSLYQDLTFKVNSDFDGKGWLWAQPTAWPLVRDVCTGYLAASPSPRQRAILLSQEAAFATAAGQGADATRALAAMTADGLKPEAQAFAALALKPPPGAEERPPRRPANPPPAPAGQPPPPAPPLGNGNDF